MEVQYSKQYVAVDVHYPAEGYMKPVRTYWPDGQVFEIQHSSKPENAASLKVGGAGVRFRVLIPGEEKTYQRDLWFVDNTWYVEVKVKVPA